MNRYHVKRTRDYYPHHTLLGAAYANLKLAEKKEPGWLYFEMAAILFSGLAVEAIANSFGERYVANWKDFESASPIAKLQIVAKAMEVDFDEKVAPWCHARWMIKFRNRLAHAKPEAVIEEREMSKMELDNTSFRPHSKIEKEITFQNAKRAVDTASSIRNLLCEKIPRGDLNNLRRDGWSSCASPIVPLGGAE